VSTVSNSPKPRPARAFARGLLRAVRQAGVRGGARPLGQLAIDALPGECGALEAGKLYAIYAAARTPGADALLWESARAAQARDVTVVLARTRAQVAERLHELGFGTNAPASGWPRNLSVLAMPPGDGAHAATHGIPPVALAKVFGGLRALKRFGFRARSLYFVEGAERWFNWNDPAALAREGRMLANWCAVRRITLVLLLGSPADTGGEAGADGNGNITAGAAGSSFAEAAFDSAAAQLGRNELHAACAGVARMEHTHGELLWHVDFWRSARTLVTGEVRSLRFTGNGGLSVAPDGPGTGAAGNDRLLARDEQRVVVSRAVVRGHEAWVPRNWDVLADQDAVLAACVDAQAATVVLAYTGSAQLDALCGAIHTLRRRAGRALKIVVAERGEVLRHQYELLVLTLGANLVLGRDLPFSRMQSLLQSLQGQLHTRPIAADYRTALSAALSEDVLGYLPAAAFCERVRGVLERSAVLQLPHVLARLTLLPQCAHVDALRSCVPRRAGDVFTADATHLYVFLFACRRADADAALARIFDVPVERFADDVVHLAEQGIGDELTALATLNRRTPVADYSDLFAAPPRGQAAAVGVGAQAGDAMSAIGRLAAAGQPLGFAGGQAAPAHGQDAGQPAGHEAAHEAAHEAVHEAGRTNAAGRVAPQPSQSPPPQRRAEPHPMPLRKKGNE
jgi:cellulose biosynthesis protein BcsE